MSLQFIIGPQTANKRESYIKEIKAIMNEKPEAKFFIIVPEHAKFEGEMTILEDLWNLDTSANSSFMGSINLQVFSFSRLAWYFLKDEQIFQKKQLSDAGMAMLLRKILLENREELVLFRKEVDKKGFIEQLINLFKEFLAGNITTDDLQQSIHSEETTVKLLDQKTKISELIMLYQMFVSEMNKNDYIRYEIIQEEMVKEIYRNDLTDTYIYIDGYYYFSAREKDIILAFLEKTTKVSIVMDLDKPYTESPPDMHQLFYVAGKTYYQMYQFARNNNIQVLLDKRVPAKENGYTAGFVELDAYWRDTTSGSRQNNRVEEQNKEIRDILEVWACDSKQAEIFHVANRINQLVKDEGYRYRDFLILSRRVEDYETILKPLFNRAELPVFYDKAEEMRHHPFTDFIDTLFRIRVNYWRYPDMMRLLRTELLVPHETTPEVFRDWVDRTENILLAYGFEGNAWFNKNDWQAHIFQEEELQVEDEMDLFKEANQIKNFLQSTLLPFYQKVNKIKTGRDAATLLYMFLVENGIDKQILHWRDQAIEKNHLEKARQHEQLWQTFNTILDEYVETLGDYPFDEATFHDILMTGFETATYSIVPPTLDEVVFSSIEGARFKPEKIVFLIGVTQENLPRIYENKTLLTEEERQLIQSNLGEEINKHLNLSVSESTASEPYVAYQAFLSATEKIFVTYPLSIDGNNRISKLSPYVARIASDAGVTVQHRAANVTEAHYPINFVGSKIQNIGQLVQLLREQFISQAKMPLLWRHILSYLYKDESIQENLKRVFASLKYKNVPAQLTPEIAEALYGKNLYLSVSQLESYYLDSYSHFLKYGLRIKERQKYELNNAGTGEFYHEALEHVVSEIRGQKELSPQELNKLTTRILENLYGTYKYEILSSSNRMQFIRDQLSETIQRMAYVISNQRAKTTFENLRTEAVFGIASGKEMLKGIQFPLKGGRSINIRGKIDRIDRVKTEDKQFLTVLDYKSSKHAFDFSEAYYGLAMQMITYLDVAMVNASQLVEGEATPAGAFYLHIQNPYLKVTDQPTESELAESLMANSKLKGLLIADKEMTEQMDPHVNEGESSLVLPFKYKKDGSFAKVADLVAADELELLILNNRRRIVEAGENILSGELKMNPIKDKLFIPTVQGPYRAISQFDSTLRENKYRRIEKLDKNTVLNRLREELIKEEEEGSDNGNDTAKNSK
ncbi:PD-(D/E)XK nuclease family protein [Jeotgalibaca sp. A127]|uniref:PD-(D/E)XK nuclease family protein n=1 Tax=Jeotgalibaca sp. A127 TaxID=3457324 RepID=UPI003FD44C38